MADVNYVDQVLLLNEKSCLLTLCHASNEENQYTCVYIYIYVCLYSSPALYIYIYIYASYVNVCTLP